MKVTQLLTMLFLAIMVTACNSTKDVLGSADESTELKSQDSERKGERRGNRTGAPNIDRVFQADANNDGLLSKTEVNERMLKRFDSIDTNADGFISRTEFTQAPKPGKRKAEIR